MHIYLEYTRLDPRKGKHKPKIKRAYTHKNIKAFNVYFHILHVQHFHLTMIAKDPRTNWLQRKATSYKHKHIGCKEGSIIINKERKKERKT